jgi:hypothetical protein
MSVRPSAWNSPVSTGRIFMKYYVWGIFLKSVEKIQLSLKPDKYKRYFTWRSMYLCTFMIISRWNLIMKKSFRQKLYNKSKNTLHVQSRFFFRKSCRLWDNVEKYCTAKQAIDDNMAHALCMLDTSVYKHPLRIRNTYCSSPATTVARMRLNATFILHYPHCYDSQNTNWLFPESALTTCSLKCRITVFPVRYELTLYISIDTRQVSKGSINQYRKHGFS